MFYKKPGIPEVGDIVICTVKKIQFHSVFVELDEYQNKEAMLHISEVSPGRIRNIRDYVKEGKRIICKVLKIHSDRGHIDVSLRRVNKSQEMSKKEESKQEQKSEKILEFIGKKTNQSLEKIYKEFGENIINLHGGLSYGMQAYLQDNNLIKELKLPKKTEEIFIETIKEKIKIPEVKININLELSCSSSDGINVIKKILKKIQKKNMEIQYIGAPKYNIIITSDDIRKAEEEFQETKESLERLSKENNCNMILQKIK